MDGYYEQADTGEAVRETALTELDAELDRLDKTVSMLIGRLEPVLSQYDTEKVLDVPTPEPASQLRKRTIRLRRECQRIDMLLRDLDI